MNKKIVLLGALILCVTTTSLAMKKQHKETQELKNWVAEQQHNLSGKDDTTKKKGESTETLRDKTFEKDFEGMLQGHPTLGEMSEKEWMELCTDETLDAYWAEIFNKESDEKTKPLSWCDKNHKEYRNQQRVVAEKQKNQIKQPEERHEHSYWIDSD